MQATQQPVLCQQINESYRERALYQGSSCKLSLPIPQMSDPVCVHQVVPRTGISALIPGEQGYLPINCMPNFLPRPFCTLWTHKKNDELTVHALSSWFVVFWSKGNRNVDIWTCTCSFSITEPKGGGPHTCTNTIISGFRAVWSVKSKAIRITGKLRISRALSPLSWTALFFHHTSLYPQILSSRSQAFHYPEFNEAQWQQHSFFLKNLVLRSPGLVLFTDAFQDLDMCHWNLGG